MPLTSSVNVVVSVGTRSICVKMDIEIHRDMNMNMDIKISINVIMNIGMN